MAPEKRFLIVLATTFGASIFSLLSVGQSDKQDFKRFDNSIVTSFPSGRQPVVAQLNENVLERSLVLHFSLKTANLQELEARVAKGEIISPAEMKEKYSGNVTNFDSLVTWLKKQGFKITNTSEDHTSVYARATVSQIQNSLRVKMQQVTYNGITTPAATTPPELPREVGDSVVAIDGLQPFIRAVKHTVRSKEPADSPGKGAAVQQSAYKAGEILKGYGANGLGLTGTGQVIGILIDTVPNWNDLEKFWSENKLSTQRAQITFLNVKNSKALPPQDGEETLDTEWATAIAPAASIRVYAVSSTKFTDLDLGLEQIYLDAQKIPGFRQVSVSLGLREDHVSTGEVQIEHAAFVKLAAVGVSVFVSSGDAGSNPDDEGKRGQDVRVEYQASDPFIIAVGGTTLTIDRGNGSVSAESGWKDSGGGFSTLFSRQSWQHPYNGISGMPRLVPDVSAVADPSPGASVWFNGKEKHWGGTSWSAPLWAGFSALIGEGRQNAHKHPLGFLAPLLYTLPQNCFRDVTSGSNGAYSAGVGWDPVTGIGVPQLHELVQALNGLP